MNNYETSPANTKAVLSFFFAILGLVLCFIPIMSFLFIIVSAALGLTAYRDGNRGGAVAGLAICVVAALVALIVWISSGSLGCSCGKEELHDNEIGYSDDYVGDDVSDGDFVSGADLSESDDSTTEEE